MNDTMIQEAVLDSIESINEQQLYAEFDVLLSMADVYEKAMFIEESSDLTFDGYEVVQEADEKGIDTVKSEKDGTYTSVGKPSKKYKIGKGGFWNWLKGAFAAIGKAFSTLWAKITGAFKTKDLAVPTNYALSVANNGGEVKLDAKFAEKVGVSTDCFQTKNTEEIKKVKAATGDKVPNSAFEMFKVPIHYNPAAIKFGVESMNKALEHYKHALDQEPFKMEIYDSIMKQVKPIREKAYKMLTKGHSPEGKVSSMDYKQIMTDMINCQSQMKSGVKYCEDVKKILDEKDFADETKRAFDISSVEVKRIQDDVKPMLNLCRQLLSYSTELLKEISPAQIKKRAQSKLADIDYEEAEDKFGANAEFPG